MLNIPTAKAKIPQAQPTTAMPGTTSLAEQPAAPAGYEYLGRGSEDPIAQRVVKQFGGGEVGSSPYGEWAATAPRVPGKRPGFDWLPIERSSSGPYISVDPSTWGTRNSGSLYEDMKRAYVEQGGMGTYEQLAVTNPAAVGRPYVTATGKPAPVFNAQTGMSETPTLEGIQWGWNPQLTPEQTAAKRQAAVAAQGSLHTLAPEVINKMWR
jgi:hypothetical protein